MLLAFGAGCKTSLEVFFQQHQQLPVTSSPVSPVTSSPVSPKQGGREHCRALSEGVFDMSSDQALFGLACTPAPETSSPRFSLYPRESSSASVFLLSREKQLEREAAEKATGYFATFMFQNSSSSSPEGCGPSFRWRKFIS